MSATVMGSLWALDHCSRDIGEVVTSHASISLRPNGALAHGGGERAGGTGSHMKCVKLKTYFTLAKNGRYALRATRASCLVLTPHFGAHNNNAHQRASCPLSAQPVGWHVLSGDMLSGRGDETSNVDELQNLDRSTALYQSAFASPPSPTRTLLSFPRDEGAPVLTINPQGLTDLPRFYEEWQSFKSPTK